MATSSVYKDFILEQLSKTDGLTFKPMMNEYLLYKDGVLIGGIYDNRLLLKKTEENTNYGFAEEFPYDGAKSPMIVAPVDDTELLGRVVLETFYSLKKKV